MDIFWAFIRGVVVAGIAIAVYEITQLVLDEVFGRR